MVINDMKEPLVNVPFKKRKFNVNIFLCGCTSFIVSFGLTCTLMKYVVESMVLSSYVNETFATTADLCVFISNDEIFDCFPESGANEKLCLSRGCCWKKPDTDQILPNIPWCFYPRNYTYYKYVNVSETKEGLTAVLQLTKNSSYPKNVNILRMDIIYQNENILHVKIFDPADKRYESIYPKIRDTTQRQPSAKNYEIEIDNSTVGFIVKRPNYTTIFNCVNKGGFIFSDQLLQLSATFAGNIFGLGERQGPLELNRNWTRITLFNRDGIPTENENLYGSHPFYLILEPNGMSHGVYLHNSNAMDIVLQPLSSITFRPIGGIFDFYFFMGPTPADVIRQYTGLIGRPFMPPYWSLGFHLCRLGYKSPIHIEEVLNRTIKADIPVDVQWIDIDYMNNRNDFTVDKTNFKDLPQLVERLHKSGMHFIPILDPGVSASEPNGTYPPYDLGIQLDIFLKNINGSVFVGKVWNRNSTVFPDFTNRKSFVYWTGLIHKLHDELPFDGLWIDMNEPSNFLDGAMKFGCPENTLENPPFVPKVVGNVLKYKTVCMSAVQFGGSHYNVHNLYGISEGDATYRAVLEVLQKRPFIISRSTFAGNGQYTGHWSGDVVSTWHDMKMTVPELLSFSIFGIPMMGSDICGFNGNTTKYLCLRWHQLGAFYPFSRNHNTDDAIDQDPASLGEEVANATRDALKIRYSLLPYLYTLFWKAHTNGDTVARPMFFEFPDDPNTLSVDTAFFWGRSLLIVPVLEEFATTVSVYLPKGRWYDWYSQTGTDSSGLNVSLPAPTTIIPIMIRGGSILPLQKPAINTVESRKQNFTLLCAYDLSLSGVGTLFWDDGESVDNIQNGNYGLVEFYLNSTNLVSSVTHWSTIEPPCMETVQILGFVKTITNVYLNSTEIQYSWNSTALVLTLHNICVPLEFPFNISWSP